MAKDFQVSLTPSGPISAAFTSSIGGVRCIMGPIGSGKTSTCMFDLVQKGLLNPKSPVDDIRRAKFAVIRDTYRNLWRTTIKSWNMWFPQEFGRWQGGKDGPAIHEMTFDLGPELGKYELIIEFIALGDDSVEDVMRGWEGTGAYLNEADALAEDVIEWVDGRCGRYPPAKHGGCRWSGVVLDCNAPSYDNWVYERFVKEPEEGWEFYQQPGGMIKIGPGQYEVNPKAENLHNLPADYYPKNVKGKKDWYVRRMILNLFGFTRQGKPVYEDFNDQFHASDHEIPFIQDLPLIVGMDAGMTPAAIFMQQLADGQWRILREFIPGHCSATKFGRLFNIFFKQNFPTARTIAAWCDPSAEHGGDEEDLAWMLKVSKETGFRIRPAPTNVIQDRIDAVSEPLTELIDGRKPGLILDPSCLTLRRGFNDGYHYKKIKGGSVTVYDDKPNKNEYSHPHDALQYGVLGGGEHADVIGRQGASARGQAPVVAQTDFNPLG